MTILEKFLGPPLKREKEILLRWKRLLVGVLTKDRLEREYGDNDEDED